MAKWMVSAKKADFNAIAEKFRIDPVIARIIRNRDIVGEEAIDRFLHGTLRDLHDPFLLADAQKGAEIVREEIAGGKRIRIIGIMISTASAPLTYCWRDWLTAGRPWTRRSPIGFMTVTDSTTI